jgi:alpha-glucosidase (family GH31 glycosyl hydrolase)
LDQRISRRSALLAVGGTGAFFLVDRSTGAAEAPVTISDRPVGLSLTAVSGNTLRITVAPLRSAAGVNEWNDDPVLALAKPPRPILKTNSTPRSSSLAWGDRKVRVSLSPLTIQIEDRSGQEIQSLRIDQEGAVAFHSSNGPVFGLGEGGPQFDRRREEYNMRNGQLSSSLATIGARQPIPWLVASEGWAIFFHRPFGVIDLSGPEYRFEQPAVAVEDPLPLDLFFVASKDPSQIMKAYADITGFPHLPPLWAFGYQQSHRTLASREEVLKEAAKFRADKLPCDTMIYLGTGFCPSGWNTGHGSFEFNSKVFPDPKNVFDELHRDHFHVVLHLTRPPEHLHGRVTDRGADSADFSDVARYWRTHLKTLRLGVDGWWPDEGDPLDADARFVRNRMYWEGPRLEHPDQRPFALHRNCYAGVQRYGWLWSGDVQCTWKTLAAQVPVGLNTGLSGIPYWGTDTGGFVPTKELTGELYVRWFQFSAFCPLFRSHGRAWKLRLPWGWNTGEIGPGEGPEDRLPDAKELRNAKVEPICRKYLETRYRLLPYIYSAARQAHDSSMPMMRALWLHYPNDAEAVGVSDQYLSGRDILVAPITEPGATRRSVYLPAGTWYDFWTGEGLEGGRHVDRPVDLQTMPVLVRAGATIPFGPVKQYVSEKSSEPLVLRVFPGKDGESHLYADDGESFGYERGEFFRLEMRWLEAARTLTLSMAPGSKLKWLGYPSIQVELSTGGTTKAVRFEGQPVTVNL